MNRRSLLKFFGIAGAAVVASKVSDVSALLPEEKKPEKVEKTQEQDEYYEPVKLVEVSYKEFVGMESSGRYAPADDPVRMLKGLTDFKDVYVIDYADYMLGKRASVG